MKSVKVIIVMLFLFMAITGELARADCYDQIEESDVINKPMAGVK